ncbi:MAG: LytTR family DNA-binding domain-containing protein [Candidatus Izemoplasmatales bacterium]|nr:LytTR family DNA-binding domain-containing protein [bacterium]MDZ4197291.1 LytTR family DNA-binding domain-containing protein [Candidatus Izemoplasmatales bacterium]
MEIKLKCRKENEKKYKEMLELAGFVISPTADLTFQEDDFIQDSFLGKVEDVYEIIPFQKVVLIEAFGHEVFLYTLEKKYIIKERLYEVEGLFDDVGYIRINKSQIVNKAMIKEIRPAFNSKLTLLLKNKQLVDVTRSYQVRFKESIGL